MASLIGFSPFSAYKAAEDPLVLFRARHRTTFRHECNSDWITSKKAEDRYGEDFNTLHRASSFSSC